MSEEPASDSPRGRIVNASVDIPVGTQMVAEAEILESHISRAEVNHGLGKFIVEFHLLETLIKDAISFLLNPTDSTPGRIVTAGVPFIQLLNILIALFHHETRDDEETETLRTVLEECGKTNTRPNQLVHSFWYMEDRENTRIDICVKRLKPYREDHEQNVSGETLEANTRECRERRERFEALMEKRFPKWSLREMPSEE